MSNKFVHVLFRLMMHSTKRLATMNPQGGAACSSTFRIHCETIAYGNRGALHLVFIF